MSELTDSLRAHGQRHMGTDLGGLLQWAALHIDAQDEALAELREEYAREESDRMGLEGTLGAAKEAIEAAAHSPTPAASAAQASAVRLSIGCSPARSFAKPERDMPKASAAVSYV